LMERERMERLELDRRELEQPQMVRVGMDGSALELIRVVEHVLERSALERHELEWPKLERRRVGWSAVEWPALVREHLAMKTPVAKNSTPRVVSLIAGMAITALVLMAVVVQRIPHAATKTSIPWWLLAVG